MSHRAKKKKGILFKLVRGKLQARAREDTMRGAEQEALSCGSRSKLEERRRIKNFSKSH